MGDRVPRDVVSARTVGIRYGSEGEWLLTCQCSPIVISTVRVTFDPAPTLGGTIRFARTSGFSTAESARGRRNETRIAGRSQGARSILPSVSTGVAARVFTPIPDRKSGAESPT